MFQVPLLLQSTETPAYSIFPFAPPWASKPPSVLTQPGEGTTPATVFSSMGVLSRSLLKLKPIESCEKAYALSATKISIVEVRIFIVTIFSHIFSYLSILNKPLALIFLPLAGLKGRTKIIVQKNEQYFSRSRKQCPGISN